jgi:arginase family enzyme
MLFDCVKNALNKLSTAKSIAISCRQLNVGIIGSPFSGGQRTDGTELAPKYFRKSGLKGHIEKLGHKVTDYGDLNFQFDKSHASDEWSDLKMNYGKDVFGMAQKLSSQVQQVLKSEQICINLGGDHSLGK